MPRLLRLFSLLLVFSLAGCATLMGEDDDDDDTDWLGAITAGLGAFNGAAAQTRSDQAQQQAFLAQQRQQQALAQQRQQQQQQQALAAQRQQQQQALAAQRQPQQQTLAQPPRPAQPVAPAPAPATRPMTATAPAPTPPATTSARSTTYAPTTVAMAAPTARVPDSGVRAQPVGTTPAPRDAGKASTNDDPALCISQPQVGKYEHCSGRGLTASVRNGCAQKVDVRLCHKKADGHWTCMIKDAAPGQSTSFPSCFATGPTFVDVRYAGQSRRFQDPPGTVD